MKVDKSNPQHWALLFVQGCYALLGVFYRFITPAASRPTVVFYGLHALIPFLRMTNITSIDVWHGIPFKGYSRRLAMKIMRLALL